MKEKGWIHGAAITVTVLGGTLAAYVLFRTVLPLLLPFFIALGLCWLLRPLADRFSKRTGLPLRLVFATVVVLCLLFVGVLLFFACQRILLEAQHFLESLGKEGSGTLAGAERIGAFFRQLLENAMKEGGALGWLSYFVENPTQMLQEQGKAWLLKLTERLPTLVGRVLGALPKIFFFLLVTVISCIYVALDFPRIKAVLLRLLPKGFRGKVPALCEGARRTLFLCVRAYFLLFLITFAELAVGLFLLRVPYVLLPALLIALLDILPVFGVGSALLPWSVFALVGGNTFLAVGLLVLYGVMTLVRQVLEPHVVGKSLGIHPLLMLFSFYLTICLFGAWGILLGPVLSVCMKYLGLWRLQKEGAPNNLQKGH